MNARALSIITLTLVSASMLACLGIGKDPEGTNGGECSDAADNDEDGLWDCEDPDCEGSPDCPCAGENYDYDEFGDDMLLAACDKFAACDLFTDYFTYQDCLALSDVEDTGEPWRCADFDCEAGFDCVTAYQTVSCDDFMNGVGLDDCEDVCSND